MHNRAGPLLLSVAISMQAASAPAAPADSNAAIAREMQAFALAHGKYDDKIPAPVLGLLKLNGGLPGYAGCLVAWQDDNDNSYHYIIAGLDKQNLILVYKPADKSSSLLWRTDSAGAPISTVRSDTSGVHAVANDAYADRLNGELDYWKIHLSEEEQARAEAPPCTPA